MRLRLPSRFFVYLVWFNLFLANSLYADTESATQLTQTLAEIKTLDGVFRQTISDSDGEVIQSSEGIFKIARPGKFLWHVSPPFEQIVIGTPDTLKVYDPDLEQLIIQNNGQYIGTPAALISGQVDEIEKLFYVVLELDSDHQRFELRQKDVEQSSFEQLLLEFTNESPAKLKRMSFVDKLGQKTEVILSDLKINQPVPDSVFIFEAPEGTDVIIDG